MRSEHITVIGVVRVIDPQFVVRKTGVLLVQEIRCVVVSVPNTGKSLRSRSEYTIVGEMKSNLRYQVGMFLRERIGVEVEGDSDDNI